MANDLAIIEKANSIREFIHKDNVVKQLSAALPKFLSPDRFLRTFYTALLRNPTLMDCTRESMLSAMIVSAQLGLEPIMNKAALVPYGKEVQFQPMYGGLIELARRTMQVIVTAHVVHQNDHFDYEYGLNETLVHRPASDDRGEPIGAYTVWSFENGMKSFLYMPAIDIFEIRDKYSKAYKFAKENPKNERAQQTPWITRPGEMMKKTVIKQHGKLQPCSIEMEMAVELDHLAEAGKTQLGSSSLLGFTDLSVPKGNGGDEFGSLVADYDKEKVDQFLDSLVEHYKGKGDYGRDQLKAEAVKSPASFISGLDKYIEDHQTLRDEIGRLKAVGLKEWELENRSKIAQKLFHEDDLSFFMEKWKKVIGFDYTMEGQPGYHEHEPKVGSNLGSNDAFSSDVAQYKQIIPSDQFEAIMAEYDPEHAVQLGEHKNEILKKLKQAVDAKLQR